ncbi:OmpA family protein [Chryseobacterium taiwanense]|nr:OmpA family protein [Chryseobacterium taiwanense]
MKSPIFLIVIALALTSCVSSKKYTELQSRFDAANSENVRYKTELASGKTRINSLEEAIESEKKSNLQLQKTLSSSQNLLADCLAGSKQGGANIAKLVDEIKESNRYIQHLVNTKNKSDSLNMVLTNNLTRSLSREELRDVDIQVLKGVVYISLSDNMLYKSGDYHVSDVAGATLTKIAKIIKDYKDYDVLIEGNTDNVPISRENIRNNWDLSTLRASSVVQELQNKYGVDPSRLTAGGRGEYNPLVANDTEAGRAKNRRTQIIITPKLDQFMELIGQAPTEKSN